MLALIALWLGATAGQNSGTQWHWKWLEMKGLSNAPIIRQMKVTNDVKQSVIEQSVEAMRSDKDLFGDLADPQLWYLAANEGYMLADLDSDGKLDLITQGYGVDQCGGVGNCTLRVFKRTIDGYKLVLNTKAQTLMVDRSGTRPLLVLYTHSSAMGGALVTYRFSANRGAKKVQECDVNWNNNANEELNTPGKKSGVPTLDCTLATR